MERAAAAPSVTLLSCLPAARFFLRNGERTRADALATFAKERADLGGVPVLHAVALNLRGLVNSDPDVLLQAVELFRRLPRPHPRAGACVDAARALAGVGRRDEASELFEEARRLYEDLDAQ
jgi:hypothetical protein